MLKLVEYEYEFYKTVCDEKDEDLIGTFILDVDFDDDDEMYFWLQRIKTETPPKERKCFSLGDSTFDYSHLYYFEHADECYSKVFRNAEHDKIGEFLFPVFHKMWTTNILRERGWNIFLIRKYLTEISTNFGIFYDADEVFDAEKMMEVKTELSLKKLIED